MLLLQFIIRKDMMMVTQCALVIPVSKPRNWIAKDLRSPKYRCKVEDNKKRYNRKEKHRGRFEFA